MARCATQAAIADALDPAGDRDLADRAAHIYFPSPRYSLLRAFTSASRIARSLNSGDARPLRSFGAGSLAQCF